jgi:hypothetical protein
VDLTTLEFREAAPILILDYSHHDNWQTPYVTYSFKVLPVLQVQDLSVCRPGISISGSSVGNDLVSASQMLSIANEGMHDIHDMSTKNKDKP